MAPAASWVWALEQGRGVLRALLQTTALASARPLSPPQGAVQKQARVTLSSPLPSFPGLLYLKSKACCSRTDPL